MWTIAAWGRAYLNGVRILFGLALVLPMLTYGAVDFEPLSLCAILIAVSAFLICWRPVKERSIAWIAVLALLCLSLIIAVEYIQSLRFPNNPFEHPSWKYVREFIGPVEGAISVSPEQTRADIITWVPILAFVVSLQLFNRTSEAFSLIKALSYLNVAVTIISLVQFVFFPTDLGFGDKQFYLGSLTGLYVNRNSAGTFFGVGIIISIGLIVFYLQGSDYKSLIQRIVVRNRLSRNEKTAIFLGAGAVVEVLALAATQSRGAEASTFVAILGLVWIFNRGKVPTVAGSRRRSRVSRSERWIRIITIVCAVFSIAVLVGQEAVYRMDAQSVDQARLCTYAATWHAIVDNWPWGSGFGTFPDVFPAYRTPECSGIDGVWDAAHDSYLEGMLGLGVTFVIVLIVGYLILIWAFIRGLRARSSNRFAPAIGLMSLILVGLHSLIDFSMQIPGNALFMAALFAGCGTLSLTTRSGGSARLSAVVNSKENGQPSL